MYYVSNVNMIGCSKAEISNFSQGVDMLISVQQINQSTNFYLN